MKTHLNLGLAFRDAYGSLRASLQLMTDQSGSAVASADFVDGVVFLAGDKGRKLELASSTLFAAQQIYKASSPLRVSPVRFFEKNEVAMADIERCAEEEAKATS